MSYYIGRWGGALKAYCVGADAWEGGMNLVAHRAVNVLDR